MSGFDLVFLYCLSPASCLQVHLSSEEGSELTCQSHAQEIIADWASKRGDGGNVVAVKWKCLPTGTVLPEDDQQPT